MSLFKGSKNVLSAKDILGVSDIKIELVEVPEWGGNVYVKGMTGAERDKFEGGIVRIGAVPGKRGKPGTPGKLDLTDLRAKICSMTICDADGKRLFTEEDVQALSQKSAAALQRVFVVAQKLSGIGEEDIEELLEGFEKNPTEDSASDSLDI